MSSDNAILQADQTNRPAIEVMNLHRSFSGVHAVQGVSFSIQPGQVVGFVGANGAGKTTTLRILASLDYPTAGEARICGYNVVTHPAEVRSRIGWMPDHYGVYKNMTVLEYLDFFARSFGFTGKDRIDRIAEILEFTDLIRFPDQYVNTLSKGVTQRLCLGRALIHDPAVMILDEPAAGLDPKARIDLKHLIRILAEDGKTILISSHILSELEEMCDTLLFIDKGRIVHYGSSESLRRGNSSKAIIEVKLAEPMDHLKTWCDLAPNVAWAGEVKDGCRIEIASPKPELIAATLRRMVNDGIPVMDYHLVERRLEDAFVDLLNEFENPSLVSNSTSHPRPSSVPPPFPSSESLGRQESEL